VTYANDELWNIFMLENPPSEATDNGKSISVQTGGSALNCCTVSSAFFKSEPDFSNGKAAQLAALARELSNCSACPLRQDCRSPVGWYGDPESPILFVGEGPGGVEDDYGCPLIGPSGQLLDKALWSVRITRDRVMTSNVVKCRPRGNRTPDLAEGEFCAQRFLEREIAILRPAVIVALGGVALHYLGSPDMRITRQRGQWFTSRQGIPCLATFHPSYLLRQNGAAQVRAKWDVFHDLSAVRSKAAELRPDYELCGKAPVKLLELFSKRGSTR